MKQEKRKQPNETYHLLFLQDATLQQKAYLKGKLKSAKKRNKETDKNMDKNKENLLFTKPKSAKMKKT